MQATILDDSIDASPIREDPGTIQASTSLVINVRLQMLAQWQWLVFGRRILGSGADLRSHLVGALIEVRQHCLGSCLVPTTCRNLNDLPVSITVLSRVGRCLKPCSGVGSTLGSNLILRNEAKLRGGAVVHCDVHRHRCGRSAGRPGGLEAL